VLVRRQECIGRVVLGCNKDAWPMVNKSTLHIGQKGRGLVLLQWIATVLFDFHQYGNQRLGVS